MKFWTKQVQVDAVQLDTGRAHKMDLPEGVDGWPSIGSDNWNYEGCRFFVQTVDGRVEVRRGDWIVTWSDGKRDVVRPEEFETRFGPADGGRADANG